jgi:hypothetical protein
VVAGACSDTRGPPAQPWIIPQPHGDDEGGDGASDGNDDGGGGLDSAAPESSGDGPSSHTEVTANDNGGDSLDGANGDSSSEAGDGPPESPYMGDWDIGDCQDDIVAASDVLSDISLSDQFGESVRLYDFCHKAILLTDGSFW